MKLSRQIGRGLTALALCAAIGTYAFAAGETGDVDYPKVAHARVDIVTLPSQDAAPRWAVASVRVGDPVKAPRISRTRS
ncbi:MAG TPA: hypothetical protein VF132_02395 [Rudaea sp.]